MKYIIISNGRGVAQVDNDDYERINIYKWYFDRLGYAIRTGPMVNGIHGATILMHREIILPPENMDIDHIDGNPINNCKANLRIATASQNMGNRRKAENCSSRYKGVYWNRQQNKWATSIQVELNKLFLGYFVSENAAAATYNAAAIEHFGVFARLNVIDEG
jgi:hypothetical protein